jgi:hypothetical protein
MSIISIQDFQYATTVIVALATLLFICIYRPKQSPIEIIQRILEDKFLSFKEIPEDEFTGAPPHFRKCIPLQTYPQQVLTFSIDYHIDIRSMMYAIRNGLEEKKYAIILTVKSRSGWVLKIQKNKEKYTIDIIEGLYVPHSFLVQVQKTQ